MQIAPVTNEEIRPLLRPAQVEEALKDIAHAEAKLKSDGIQDKREARNQLIRLRQSVTAQIPQPPANAEEEGRFVARSKELLEYVQSEGMLSAAEMRACPPGAPDEHLRWETKVKRAIIAWKNYQLRLKPGEREAANLERHRPKVARLNLDNALVERKQYYGVEDVETVAVVFSDDELIALEAISPEDHARVASMGNDERAVWKKAIGLFMLKGKKKAA